MADCGASGTALDRAARSLLGGSQSGVAGKHLENVLGHVVVAGQLPAAAMMPATAPTRVCMPGTVSPSEVSQVPVAAAVYDSSHPIMGTVWESNLAQMQPTTMMNPNSTCHQQAMHAQMSIHQHQHQMNAMMMMHHHQQHQSLYMQQQRDRKSEMEKQRSEIAEKESAATIQSTSKITEHQGVEDWHQGLENDIPNDLREQLSREYDEMLSGGGSIQELAEAWAQAEAEYSAELAYDDDYDPTNMWTGEDPGAYVTTPYEYVNQTEPSENLDWMDEGMKHFQQGNLRRAIYSFEMELQHTNEDNSMAWRMLGRCHAENDQDDLAIRCLEAAVDRDPYSPESLLALGVSYVNELQHEKALENLKAWITNNPKYAGIDLPEDIYSSAAVGTDSDSAFDEVKKLLLAALDFDPSDAGDVYEALGVIYNVNKDYESAVESFRKAISFKEGLDYQLYNKLGATLANSGRSEEALPLYHKALQIKPKYARAFLNMAIAHSNLKNHDDAARCYLQALSLNPSATHCWTYLRMALSCAERWDLLSHVFSQDLTAFQAHYDFVVYDS